MKKRFNLMGALLFGFMLLGSLTLTSCSKDDDDDGDGKIDPNTIATANLIAYFSFDAEPTAGAAVEKSNNTITYVKKAGAASFATGRRGNGYKGSSNESYLEYNIAAGSALKSVQEFSMACWIKTPNTTSGASKIFTVNGGDAFMGTLCLMQESQATGDSVDMKFYLYDSQSANWKGQDIRKQSIKFTNDIWFHLVAVYNKTTSTMEFYANGTKVYSAEKWEDSDAVVPRPPLGAVTLGQDMTKIHFGAWTQQIAGTPEGWMTYFKGIVDEFRIYNKALTVAEILNLYNAEVTQIN